MSRCFIVLFHSHNFQEFFRYSCSIKYQSNISLLETLSPFVTYVAESAQLTGGGLVEVGAIADNEDGTSPVLGGDWTVGDGLEGMLFTFPKNTSAQLTYKVKVMGGIGDSGGDDGEADVGGPTPWVAGEMDAEDPACWDQEYAEGAGSGNGWVVGENVYDGDPKDVISAADAGRRWPLSSKCGGPGVYGECDLFCQ